MTRFAPHPFSLRQLQYVVAVADTLSFRKAAERCAVSQPSLSAQLALVESSLGVQLFERDHRRVLLTAAGRELVERARRVLLEADQLVEAAERVGDPFTGSLRIGVIPTISPYLLPSIAPGLRAEYADLTLMWVEDKTEVLLRRLDNGSLDAALLALEAEIGAVESEVIAIDRFLLATPPGHALAASPSPAKISELCDVDILLLDDGHCLREQAWAACASAKPHELEFRATSLSTLAQMVAGGAGVTLLPELSLASETRGARLSLRRFAEPAPHRTVALVWRKHSPLAVALRQLAATIRATYPAVPIPATLAAQRGRSRRRKAGA